MAFEKEIKEYEELRRKYQPSIINKMDREEYIKYNEVLFSPSNRRMVRWAILASCSL